jgi:hypothetical protein
MKVGIYNSVGRVFSSRPRGYYFLSEFMLPFCDSPVYGGNLYLKVGNSFLAVGLIRTEIEEIRGQCLIFPELGIDDPYFDGILYEGHEVMDAQFLHHICPVFFRGLGAYGEDIGDLFGGVPFH